MNFQAPSAAATPAALEHFEHVRHPLLRRLLGYWFEKRGSRRLPALRDIDPIEIPWALSRLWIMDYLPDERRFRYRLAGEEINAAYRSNLRGCYLDEVIPPDAKDLILRKYFAVVEDGKVLHDAGRIYLGNTRFATGERLVLPVANERGQAGSILGATIYEWSTAPSRRGSGEGQRTTLVCLATGSRGFLENSSS